MTSLYNHAHLLTVSPTYIGYVELNLRRYLQADRKKLYCSKTTKAKTDAPPTLHGSLYLKWIDNMKFGVFFGNTRFKTDQAVAAYGGAVMAYSEVNDRTQCYKLFNIKLAPTKYRSSSKDGVEAVVDGTSIWAGDGKFINHSCKPNVQPCRSLDCYDNTIGLSDVEKLNRPGNRSSDLHTLCFTTYVRYLLVF